MQVFCKFLHKFIAPEESNTFYKTEEKTPIITRAKKEAPIVKVGETIEDDLFGDSAIAVSKKFKIDYSKNKQESVKKQEGDCD